MLYKTKDNKQLFHAISRYSLAVFVVFFCLFTMPVKIYALNLDFASWRIYKTPHFNVYYHNKNDTFAAAAASIAETAAVEIADILNMKKIPRAIPLILYDAGDSPSGFTNVLQNKMWISVALPEPSELSEKPWIESLIRHELTHYLMSYKLDKTIKLGMGRLIGWGVTPMWFIEGIAQHEESSWNAVKDSAVRTAILSNKFLNLSDLQIFYFFNYQGRRLGYHIGNSMVNYMIERYGPDVIARILENLSYFKLNSFNYSFKKTTGISLNRFFSDWHAHCLKKYKKQIAGKKSIKQYCKPLDFYNGLNISPAFGRSGNDLFLLSNKGRDARRLSLFTIDLNNGKNKKLIENLEDNYFFDQKAGFILFCRKSKDKYDNLVSDIFKYDIVKKEVKRITRWLQAANPVYDYKSETIFCIRQQAGATNLCRIDLNGKIIEKITALDYNCAIYDIQIPHCESDAAAKKTNGDIMFLNYFKNGKFSVACLNYDRQSADYARIIPLSNLNGIIIKPRVFKQSNGSYKIFFIKDDGNIFNIYNINVKKMEPGRYEVSKALKITDFSESVLDYDYCALTGRFAVVTQTVYGSDISILEAGSFDKFEKFKCARDEQKQIETNAGADKKTNNFNINPNVNDKNKIAGRQNQDAGFLTFNKSSAVDIAEDKNNRNTVICPLISIEKNKHDTNGTVSPYKSGLKLDYLIPMAGSQSSKSLYGVQGRFSDAINRHVTDYQLLGGSSRYRNLNASYVYRGFKPSIGIAVYDVVRDLRPGVLENLKGADLFINYKIFDTIATLDMFDRRISSNSISPRLILKNPALSDGENIDRGYFLKLLNYNAENSVDADIHPLNAHLAMLYYQNSSAAFNSFYKYKMSKIDITKWMMLSGRLKNTIKLRAMFGSSSGDYDFQTGGHQDLRGYSTRPLIGKKTALYSFEYSHTYIDRPLQLKILSINKVYPSIFYDIASSYDDFDKKEWHGAAGIELKTRLLIFRKTPLTGKTGVAWRNKKTGGKEFYTAFDLKF